MISNPRGRPEDRQDGIPDELDDHAIEALDSERGGVMKLVILWLRDLQQQKNMRKKKGFKNVW